MLTRKTRRMLFVLPIILILILLIIVALIYLYTDIFKSEANLFYKYLGQNLENVDGIYSQIGESEYNELLKQNKYTTNTQIKANYVKNIGTTSENRKNSINQLKLEINGQTDYANKYDYKDIKLINNDKEVTEIEYAKKENTYGIKFSDLFNQYVLVNNENLKELFRKIGYSEEELSNVPDKIEINNGLKDIIRFSEEEKEEIVSKYTNIISSNVSKENFSKQENQTIEINEQNISVNAYILTLKKEQLNNIYIKLLEEIKQDEIILLKIDKLQEELNKYKNEEINLREQFIEEVENIILEITKNNIGQEECNIIVYENDRTTIRTVIQNPDYEIIADIVSNENEDYLEINYKNNKTEEEKIITYKKNANIISMIYQNKETDNKLEYTITINDNIDGNKCDRNILLKFEDYSNTVEINIEQKNNIVDAFENELIFNDENSINLSLLKEEELKAVLERVNEGTSEKINDIQTNIIKKEEIWEVLNTVGIIEREQFLQEIKVTEAERERFNSKFEILQGDNLDGEAVLKVIEVIQPNLINMNVISNTELELELDRINNNEEVATTISTFIEQNKNKDYNVRVEYDEETKLVCKIILTIVE